MSDPRIPANLILNLNNLMMEMVLVYERLFEEEGDKDIPAEKIKVCEVLDGIKQLMAQSSSHDKMWDLLLKVFIQVKAIFDLLDRYDLSQQYRWESAYYALHERFETVVNERG